MPSPSGDKAFCPILRSKRTRTTPRTSAGEISMAASIWEGCTSRRALGAGGNGNGLKVEGMTAVSDFMPSTANLDRE
jgi:hypothetical protein